MAEGDSERSLIKRGRHLIVCLAVLLMRTYAIWGQSRKILYVLILLTVSEVVTDVVALLIISLFLQTIIIPGAVVLQIDLSTLECKK